MMTSAWMTVLPPRMIFVVPMICERRETLFPVSYVGGRSVSWWCFFCSSKGKSVGLDLRDSLFVFLGGNG
jgi:hypothetical protein